MPLSDKELGDLLQNVAEQFQAIDQSLARIGASLLAVKAILALQMNPSAPSEALAQIQNLENTLAKLDPAAAARQQLSDVIEAVKLWDKHGGPKQA